ncbi:MAG: hypothetical protein V3V98_09740 [Thermoplasmata archaeon]
MVRTIDVRLDCSLRRFLTNGIPEEWARIYLSDLMHLAGRKFEMALKMHNIFSKTTGGRERGRIGIRKVKSVLERERIVEHAAICLSFLFFSNVLETQYWAPTSRRGEHYDYWCFDDRGRVNIIEVGGSTAKNGASRDQTKKRKRFDLGPRRKEPTFISSVGFSEDDHIVSRYR